MKRYKCTSCGRVALSLMQKANLLAGAEYKCQNCSASLKIDGSIQMLAYILVPMSLSISFALILLALGFMIAVPTSIIISIFIYLFISIIAPVEVIKKKDK